MSDLFILIESKIIYEKKQFSFDEEEITLLLFSDKQTTNFTKLNYSRTRQKYLNISEYIVRNTLQFSSIMAKKYYSIQLAFFVRYYLFLITRKEQNFFFSHLTITKENK
jgi:hypothetical protein